MRRNRHLRLSLAILAGLGILLAWNWLPLFSQQPVAQAHAFVIGSDPVDGTTIQNAPAVVRIYFNANISPASSAQVLVFTPGGSPDGSEVDSGTSLIPAGNPRELDTPLRSPATLPKGSYEVRWTAIASDDGQATHGLIGFNIGASATGLTGNTIIGPTTSNILPQMNVQGILATLWEWISLLALTFWIGLLVIDAVFVLGVMPATHGAADNALRLLRKQGRPLQWLCLTTLLAGELINLALRSIILSQFQQSSAIDLGDVRAILLQTSYGYLWLARVGLICIALAFAWWTTHMKASKRISSKRRAMRALRGQLDGEAAQRYGATQTPQASTSSRYRQLRLQLGDELASDEDARSIGSEQERSHVPASGRPALAGSPSAEALPVDSTVVSRPQTITWLLLAALIALTIAFSGDAPQLAQTHVTAVVLNWLFLLAQAAWLGGVAVLAFVLLPLLPVIEPETPGALLVNVLRYYVPVLLAALGFLLLSGLFTIETTISGLDQLLNDPYGRSMLVALLLFTLLLLFTIYGFFYLLPAMRRQVVLLPVVNADLPARRARRSALAQSISSLKRATHILAVMGAGLLLCAALMAFYAPPIVFPPLPASSSTSSSATAIQTQAFGDLIITLQVSPARVDATNYVTVTLKDAHGNPISGARVIVNTNMQFMDMGQANKDVQGLNSSSVYTTSFTPDEAFSMAGIWVITLTIQQAGHPAVRAQFYVTLTQ